MHRLHPCSLPVVIVDDEASTVKGLCRILEVAGIDNLVGLQHGREAIALLEQREAMALLLDLNMPDLSGEQVLAHVQTLHPDLPVIVVTGNDTLETAVACMKNGAFDYLVKPVAGAALVGTVKRAIETRLLAAERREAAARFLSTGPAAEEAFSRIITRSPKMKAVFRAVAAAAPTARTVLITGETGVGKELIAKAVHRLSGRKGAYIPVNIASFDEAMFSATLFGHRKGAFTGAERRQAGLVAAAAGGTLFLDEIGELCRGCQVKLLRLLESGEYLPLGADALEKAQARIVVATNRNLEKAVEEGGFRGDLYFRLRAHQVHIPPLRERKDDLPLLVDCFARRAARELGKEAPPVPAGTLRLLESYPFPGNIRELESMIYDAVSRADALMSVPVLLRQMIRSRKDRMGPAEPMENLSFPADLPSLRQVSEQLVDEALRRSEGNQTRAARLLGVSQQALSSRLRRHRGRALEGGGGGQRPPTSFAPLRP